VANDLTVVVFEPMGLAIPLPEGWPVQAAEDGSTLAAVGNDDLGNDLLNPSVTVERKAWSSEWPELVRLAAESLDQMRDEYDGFELLWSKEHLDTGRVVRAYAYKHRQLGAVTQVQALVQAERLVMVTCTAPRETYEQLAETFERIVLGVEPVDPDDIVEEPDDD
jgi:hypothetical protein